MKKTFLFIAFLVFSCNENIQNTDRTQKITKNNLLAMVMKDGKYGYINPEGDYVISPRYPLARSFSNGMACVNFNGVRSDFFPGTIGGSYAFIDTSGKLKFEEKAFSLPVSFFNDYAIIESNNQTVGFIDKNLDLVVDGFDVLMPFREGMSAAVKRSENTVGFIDTTGEWRIKLDLKSHRIGDFHEGYAFFMKDNGYGYLNKQGEIVIEPIYEGTYDFHEGLGAFLLNKKFGFLNKEGKVVINNEYENVGDFSNGLCAVQKNGKWGYIDHKGKVGIAFEFDAVRDFNEGFASVQKQNKVGFIDKNGDWLIGPKFDNGLDFKNGYAIINKGGKLGYINAKGEIIIEPIYDRVDNFVDPFSSNENLRSD
ncbi:WG repeat-containing protein [Flagellimonas algicola]|nr:WG repeat-containing protein [Allomuricauda algicola]